jgi:hypothetical protein
MLLVVRTNASSLSRLDRSAAAADGVEAEAYGPAPVITAPCPSTSPPAARCATCDLYLARESPRQAVKTRTFLARLHYEGVQLAPNTILTWATKVQRRCRLTEERFRNSEQVSENTHVIVDTYDPSDVSPIISDLRRREGVDLAGYGKLQHRQTLTGSPSTKSQNVRIVWTTYR